MVAAVVPVFPVPKYRHRRETTTTVLPTSHEKKHPYDELPIACFFVALASRASCCCGYSRSADRVDVWADHGGRCWLRYRELSSHRRRTLSARRHRALVAPLSAAQLAAFRVRGLPSYLRMPAGDTSAYMRLRIGEGLM